MPIIPKSEFKKPSAWRSGRWKMRRSVSAVSIARSEYLNSYGQETHAAAR